jgi:hypothetical protein
MIVSWSVSDGDSLEVHDDGSWTASVTSGSDVAGRFGSRLDDEELTNVRTLSSDAAHAGWTARSEDQPWQAGMPAETVSAGDETGQLEIGAQWPDPWQPLVTWARAFLTGVTADPVAAVALDPTGDGTLRHVGSEPLTVGEAGFGVLAYVAAADGAIGESWSDTVPSPEGGSIPPGWATPIGLGSTGLSPPAGSSVEVSATFTITDPLPHEVTIGATAVRGQDA